MSHPSRVALGGALVALALLPAAAMAAPRKSTSLSKVSSPPATARAGDAFTLKGTVRNRTTRTRRVRLTVTLRESRRSKTGRIVAAKYLRRIRAGRSARYRVRVRVPKSMAARRYHVVACARAGNRRASCRFTRRKLTLRAARGRQAPSPAPSPNAPQPPASNPSPPAAQAPEPGPVLGDDGKTEPVYGYADAIRERVWVPIEFDADGNGADDRIAVDIIRPKATAEGLKAPTIMDASPYYSTVCRGNEGQCKQDVDGDGLNDKWPLFYDNYFVPRGYAVAYVDTVGTASSTGCPTIGGREDIVGITRVIDWLNGRATGYDAQSGGEKVVADWSTGNVGMWGKSFDGTHANGAAATGVEGLRTVVPISAISSWYKYYRIGGLRFRTSGPSGLANTVTTPNRRPECAPSRQRIASGAGEGDQPADTAGNFNGFWDERDYEINARNVKASVFVSHGINDLNVKPNNYDEWWNALAGNDVPRKIWLTQTGHVDPFDFDRAKWVDTIHRWFDYWLQDIDNGIMDQPMARIEQQPNLVGHTPTYKEFGTWPDAGARTTDVWFRSAPEADEPGGLSTAQQQAAGTATWVDRRDQTQSESIADPDSTANPNRLVFLSPPLAAGVRISGRSTVTVRLSADQADAAVGAMLVDYSDAPFERIEYDEDDGIRDTTTRTCWGETSVLDWGPCYLEVERRYTTTTSEVVGRGALDGQNRDSLRAKTPLAPGQKYWFQIPLWASDYTFLAGHRIGVVLVGTYRSYPTLPKAGPAPTLELNVNESKVSLPVVGGRDALGF